MKHPENQIKEKRGASVNGLAAGPHSPLLAAALMELGDGVVLSDARKEDCPVILVNPAFEKLTGYSANEILGKNCRQLQGDDRNQPERKVLKDAMNKGTSCTVTMRNYRKDGSRFWNELTVSPVHDAEGKVTHFVGIQKDVTGMMEEHEKIQQKSRSLESENRNLRGIAVTDGLTGIPNRRYFNTQLPVQWKVAGRSKRPFCIFMIDIDWFKEFNDTYGHRAGDICLKKVAGALQESFKRGSDFLARYGGEEFVVTAPATTEEQAEYYARKLCKKMSDLQIPHSASPFGYVTVSVGYAVTVPGPASPWDSVERADQALYMAKRRGRNRISSWKAPSPLHHPSSSTSTSLPALSS